MNDRSKLPKWAQSQFIFLEAEVQIAKAREARVFSIGALEAEATMFKIAWNRENERGNKGNRVKAGLLAVRAMREELNK